MSLFNEGERAAVKSDAQRCSVVCSLSTMFFIFSSEEEFKRRTIFVQESEEEHGSSHLVGLSIDGAGLVSHDGGGYHETRKWKERVSLSTERVAGGGSNS